VDDASEFLVNGVSSAFSFLSGAVPQSPPKATPDEVFNGDIDLNEEEVDLFPSDIGTSTYMYFRYSNRTGEKRGKWMTLQIFLEGCGCLP